MSRARVSLVLALAALFALAPGMPAAVAAPTDQMMGGQTGGFGPMMGPGGQMGQGGFGGMMGQGGFGGTMGGGFGGMAGGIPRGCGRGQQNVSAGAIAELPRVTVEIHDGFFVPAEISVRPGTIVVWTNRGSQPHTTTAWDRWDSGIMRPGDTCMAWFVTPGSYDYLSIVAADAGLMTGVVTVEGPPIGGGTATGTGPAVGPGTGPSMTPAGTGPGMAPGTRQ